jgi:hypothetical protein
MRKLKRRFWRSKRAAEQRKVEIKSNCTASLQYLQSGCVHKKKALTFIATTASCQV